MRGDLGNIFKDNLIDIWENNVILKMCSKSSRCLAEVYENNEKFREQIKSIIKAQENNLLR